VENKGEIEHRLYELTPQHIGLLGAPFLCSKKPSGENPPRVIVPTLAVLESNLHGTDKLTSGSVVTLVSGNSARSIDGITIVDIAAG